MQYIKENYVRMRLQLDSVLLLEAGIFVGWLAARDSKIVLVLCIQIEEWGKLLHARKVEND